MFNATKCFVICFMLISIHFEDAVLGQLTCTQRLIRGEITRLGGEWEGGETIEHIGFLAPDFKTDHFEMLRHCSGLKWFSAFEVPACDKSALKHLFRIDSVERIDVFDSDELADGLAYLPMNTSKLREVRVDASTLSKDAMLAIQKVKSLQLLSLTVKKLTPEQVDVLANTNQLKHLWIETEVPIDDALLKRIKSSLENCEVLISVVEREK